MPPFIPFRIDYEQYKRMLASTSHELMGMHNSPIIGGIYTSAPPHPRTQPPIIVENHSKGCKVIAWNGMGSVSETTRVS